MEDLDYEQYRQEYLDEDYKEVPHRSDEESETEEEEAVSEETYQQERKIVEKIYCLNRDDFASVEDYNAFLEEKQEMLYGLLKKKNEKLQQLLKKRMVELKPFRKRVNDVDPLVQKRFNILEEKELWISNIEMRQKPLQYSAYTLGKLDELAQAGKEFVEMSEAIEEAKRVKLLDLNSTAQVKEQQAESNYIYRPTGTGSGLNNALPQPKDAYSVDAENRILKKRDMSVQAEKAAGYRTDLLKERATQEAKASLFFGLPTP